MSATFQPEALYNERKAFLRRREKKRKMIEASQAKAASLAATSAQADYDNIFGGGADGDGDTAPLLGDAVDGEGEGDGDEDEEQDGDDVVLMGLDEGPRGVGGGRGGRVRPGVGVGL
jgi:hypothetical protein